VKLVINLNLKKMKKSKKNGGFSSDRPEDIFAMRELRGNAI